MMSRRAGCDAQMAIELRVAQWAEAGTAMHAARWRTYRCCTAIEEDRPHVAQVTGRRSTAVAILDDVGS
jgi:hypothetical protein